MAKGLDRSARSGNAEEGGSVSFMSVSFPLFSRVSNILWVLTKFLLLTKEFSSSNIISALSSYVVSQYVRLKF